MEGEIKHHWLDEKAQIIIPLEQFNSLKNQGLRHIKYQEELAASNSVVLEEKIASVDKLIFEIDQNGDLGYMYNLDLQTNGMASDDVDTYACKMEELASILIEKYKELIEKKNKKDVEILAKRKWATDLSFWQRFILLFDPNQ